MNLLSVVWNIDPTAFSIGGLEIRWYGVFFAICFVLGYYIMQHFCKKEGVGEKFTDSLFWYVIVAVVIGSRLGHCLFYEASYFLSKEHFWEILRIRDGGLSSHGGAFAILLALYLLSRKFKLSYLYILDRVVVTIALAGFFIRMGNLFNSEIYGHITNLPWGFVFVRCGETMPKHPTQIYEALWCLALFGLLYYNISSTWKKGKQSTNGVNFSLFLILYFGFRFSLEFIKEDQEAWEAEYLLNMGQMLSLPFVIAGVGLLWYSQKRAKR